VLDVEAAKRIAWDRKLDNDGETVEAMLCSGTALWRVEVLNLFAEGSQIQT